MRIGIDQDIRSLQEIGQTVAFTLKEMINKQNHA